jgi:PAS domain-containing protein
MQTPSPLPTAFAPAARASAGDLARQRAAIRASAFIHAAFDVVPLPMVVLNATRQIVHANGAFSRTCGPTLPDGLVGLRPGEAIRCAHADQTPGGCGTTEACRTCGIVRSILTAAKGRAASEDCRITVRQPAREIDVRVWTTPFAIEGEPFTVMILMDIGDQKRREALERIFFHDVLNTAAQ